MPLIQLHQVSKSFNTHPIFQHASASFEEGLIHGIVGPNGSGKSVLFKLICNFQSPDSGNIQIDSRWMSGRSRFPERFGIIINRPGYLASKTGLENLQRLARIQRKVGDEEIRDAMRKVGLDPGLKQKVKDYSLGMKQKLAVAQSFMENQDVLLLDEPFNALDSDSVQRIRELLLDFKREGKTILMTSHNQEDIDLLCDTVHRIRDYRLDKLA